MEQDHTLRNRSTRSEVVDDAMIHYRCIPNRFSKIETVITEIEAFRHPLSHSDQQKCNKLLRDALAQLKSAKETMIDFWNCSVDVEIQGIQAVKTAHSMHGAVRKELRESLESQMKKFSELLDTKLDRLAAVEGSVSDKALDDIAEALAAKFSGHVEAPRTTATKRRRVESPSPTAALVDEQEPIYAQSPGYQY